jgi:SAM-dependent methyltransferase
MLPEVFRTLPRQERWFVRGRLWTAPLAALAARVPSGRVLDVGCGHGALIALLLEDPQRQVVGVDPDPRKVAWARQSVGRSPRVRLVQGTLAALGDDEAGTFDAVVFADVLYLMPDAQREAVLRQAHALLRPGGRLLLKETEADGSWKHLKCLAQEAVMVKLLRRTATSGALRLLSRGETCALLERLGFEVRGVESLARGSTTPHILFDAARRVG